LPHRHWRKLRIGEIAIRIPPDWGDVEPNVDGSFIVHNRPCRFRIDGDAVWYGSAIELRISRQAPIGAAAGSPMEQIVRTVNCNSGPIVLALSIANGVQVKHRRDALRVLHTVRADPNGEQIALGAPPLPQDPSKDKQSDAP
jgi:hypothetical protein